MFSGTIIGAIVGVSVGTWVWNKTLRRTGGNNKSSIIVGAVAGLIAFFFILTLVKMVDDITNQ